MSPSRVVQDGLWSSPCKTDEWIKRIGRVETGGGSGARAGAVSDGNIALDPDRRDPVIDVRYSILPDRVDAVRDIRLNRRAPKDAHLRFYTSPGLSPAHCSELFRMLFD